jgi:hypothetical protein
MEKGDSIVLHAGSGKPHTAEEWTQMLNSLRSGESIYLVGSGYGKVAPDYFDFIEKYKALRPI